MGRTRRAARPISHALGVYDANGDLTGLDVMGPEGQPLGKFATLDLDLPVAVHGPDEMDPVTFAEVIPDLFLQLQLSHRTGRTGSGVWGGTPLVRRGTPAGRL